MHAISMHSGVGAIGGPSAAVEVVLCSYNGEKYIRRQIESILNQSIPPARISIYDDCSSDGTVHIIEDIVARNAGPTEIIFVQRPSNLGFARNFEQALKSATLELIALSDQDDIWYSNKLEVLVGAMSPEVVVAFSNALLVDQHEESLGQTLWDAIGLDEQKRSALRTRETALRLLLQKNYVTGAATMIRREFVQFLPAGPVGVPHDYWIAINALQQNALEPVNDVLYSYRQHSANVIGQGRRTLGARIRKGFSGVLERLVKDLDRYKAIASSLSAQGSVLAPAFNEKVQFLEARAQGLGSGWSGAVTLMKLLATGKYKKYLGSHRLFVLDAWQLLSRPSARASGPDASVAE